MQVIRTIAATVLCFGAVSTVMAESSSYRESCAYDVFRTVKFDETRPIFDQTGETSARDVVEPLTTKISGTGRSSRRHWLLNNPREMELLSDNLMTQESDCAPVTFVRGGQPTSHQQPDSKKSGVRCDGLKSCEPKWKRCCKPRAYAQVEAIFLDRANGFRDQPLVIDAGNNSQLLGTGGLDFDYEPGLRVLLGIGRGPCCPCSSWEFGYLGLFDQNSSTVVSGNDNLALPGDLGFLNPFATADRIVVDYASQLHAFELNCVKCFCHCDWEVEFLAGFRYLSFDENLRINAFDADENGDGDYFVRTENDLYGAQIGGRVRRRHGCRLSWEVLGKAGIYGNAAQQRQTVTLFPPLTVVNTKNSRGQVAFIGELGLSLVYDLSYRWSVRAGYNLMWIEGLALAPNQLDFNVAQAGAGTDLDSTGGVFLHGATIGLEARF